MSLVTLGTSLAERRSLPDAVIEAGVNVMAGRARRWLRSGKAKPAAAVLEIMARGPIAYRSDQASRPELPADFFGLVLGPRRKHSCCRYEGRDSTLAEAEDLGLETTAAHADLRDGQLVLELGCGWGSLSLWMAEQYPASRITAVSNSDSQREYILAQAAARGLTNLRVVTADMNDFTIGQSFDRIVSVEMLEQMTNWQVLLQRIRGWLRQDGRLFIHVFCHRTTPYIFDPANREDWIARHFFSGGILPSHDLLSLATKDLAIEAEWRWSGGHYARTIRDWLKNFDRNETAITEMFQPVYGGETEVWKRRWRLFFLAAAGLFGHEGGSEWGVSHYLLRPA
jgi:cyclopropane-fatty-acyl-phospholipid synthase